jgi:pilus assembly protein CpaB
MRREMTIALGLASLSGMVAAVGAYDWISSRSDNRPRVEAQPAIPLTQIIVAKDELKFGTVLTKDMLRMADWPVASAPSGAYASIDDFFKEQETRSVIVGMQPGEPVMKGKITGPGQRATLSTMLRAGMKAVSVRVDDVIGVAGFVLPGDYVDVLVTVAKGNADDAKEQKIEPHTDLLLQKLRVLASDQSADPRQEGAKLARTVTLEATQVEAQKITLAANIGQVTLVLREQAAEVQRVAQRRVTTEDLSEDSGDKLAVASFEPTIAVAPEAAAVPTDAVWTPARAKINVVRGVEQTEFSVARFRAQP